MVTSSTGERLKVFISYSRMDSSEFADELVAGLEIAGFAPFLDRRDITSGEDWEARLGALIQLRQAAPTTPLVFVNISDPIGSGLVSSLAYPGGNITGFTNYELSMGGKWLEILKDIAPSITRVAAIFNPDNPALAGLSRSIEAAASTLGIQVVQRPSRNAEELERTISAFALEPNGGLLVLLDFVTLAHRDLIIKLATQHRLPAGYALRIFAASGGLISYGVDPVDLFRRAASYVDRVLKGVKPADLPVQQPIKFELIINLKTAKALGLTVPETLLARADEVIE